MTAQPILRALHCPPRSPSATLILPFRRNINSIRNLRRRGTRRERRYAAWAGSRRPQPNGNLVVS